MAVPNFAKILAQRLAEIQLVQGMLACRAEWHGQTAENLALLWWTELLWSQMAVPNLAEILAQRLAEIQSGSHSLGLASMLGCSFEHSLGSHSHTFLGSFGC